MLIKIHGTSGSGKTTAVRELMEHALEVKKCPGASPTRPEAYRLYISSVKDPVFVIGSYENTCGGMDSVPSVDEQIRLIHKYAGHGHVIYEGLLMSTYYGRLGEAMEIYGRDHVWAFLDTPIDVCIERVKFRRLEAGNAKPLNEDNTRNRVKSIKFLRDRVRRKVGNIVDLDHTTNVGDQLLELLEQAI